MKAANGGGGTSKTAGLGVGRGDPRVRIAVTGARGRMGREFVPYALEQGHEVLAIDNSPPEGRGPASPGVVEVTLDVTCYPELREALDGVDSIVHLAAFPSPMRRPPSEVHFTNTVSTYNVLCAAVEVGVTHVSIASSVNATGMAYSRQPRYDYFPIDEEHPTYNEDPYSLSKWVGEAQADSIARRNEQMSISSLRLHRLVPDRKSVETTVNEAGPQASRDLWGYTELRAASRAFLAGLNARWRGHEVFYIVAPRTTTDEPTAELCRNFYPGVPVKVQLVGNQGLFRCSKAYDMLGWVHDG